MQKRGILFGAVSALAFGLLALAQANAGDNTNINGTVDGDYSHTDLSGGNGSANNWGGDGSGEFGLGWSGLEAQLDIGYHDLSIAHTHMDDFNVGGDLFWQGERGRLGGVVDYQHISCCGTSANVTNYGAFAELYMIPELTVGVKGGAFDGSFHIKGSYAGGEAVGYLMPDFALSGKFDYTSLDGGASENDYSAQGEWLVSEQTPISLTLGYTHSEFNHLSVNANTFMVGLKLYMNGNGAQTLVDRQRTGTEDWGSRFSTTGIALLF